MPGGPTTVAVGQEKLVVRINPAEYLRGGNVIPKSGHPDEVNCFAVKTKRGDIRYCAVGHILKTLGMEDDTMMNIASLEALPHGSIPDRLFKIFRTRAGRLALVRVMDINDSTLLDDQVRIDKINNQLSTYQIELKLGS